MSARVVPKSVSSAIQTAPPTSVTIHAGRNRRFFLIRAGKGVPSGLTPPTLGGQAHDETDAKGTRKDIWIWKEAKLQSAGVGINAAGSAAIAAFAESGITEYIWIWGTIENSDQGSAALHHGAAVVSDTTIRAPSSYEMTFDGRALDYMLSLSVYEPATVRLSSYDDMLLLKGPLVQTSYVAYLHETIEGDLGRVTYTTDSTFTSAGVQLNQIGAGDPKVSGPELPIHAVQTRSMDAKTIADRYNLGVAKQEDYIFNDRKFYQDGTTS